MKEKNGFTLIELLAVIVILGLLAVLVTPIVNKTLNNAKKNTFKNTVEGMIRSIQLDASNKDYSEEEYTVTNGVITDSSGTKVNTSGGSDENGKIIIDEDGNITLSVYNKKWCASKSADSNNLVLNKLEDGNCVIEEKLTAADLIINQGITETGSGLYKNPDTAGGGYVFKGSEANTNNYLIFDNKCWRVMSVEDNGQIKIIYYGSETNGICGGPGSWGTIVWNGTSASSTNDWYDENTTIRATLESLASGGSYNGFSISNLDKVADHTWNVGVVTSYTSESTSLKDFETVLEQEKNGKHSGWTHDGPYTWDNKIGIINVSDGLKSSLSYMGQGCSSAANPYLPYVCWEGNYLVNDNWTLNADDFNSKVAHFSPGPPKGAWETLPFNPVLYLKANIKITGEGTNENPFVVS